MSWMDTLFGRDGQWSSTFSPAQQNYQNQYMQNAQAMGGQDITQNQNYQTGQQYLQQMFSDPDFFSKFEAPLQRQFEEQTVPGLANQFAGMGSGGGLNSSGFRNQALREGGNLSTNIAALRGNMQQNAIPQLMNYAQQPTQNAMAQFGQSTQNGMNNVYQPATSGLLGPTLGALGGGMSMGAGMGIGDWISKLMNGNGSSNSNVGLGQGG